MNLMNKTQKLITTGLAVAFLSTTLFTGVVAANGGGLNGVGSTQTQTPSVTQTQPVTPSATQIPATTQTVPTNGSVEPSGAAVIGGMLDNIGVDQEAAQKASEYTAPLAKGANLLFAIILAIVFIAMTLITALDLMYIAVPPVRNFLLPGGANQGAGGGMMGGGMMGGGMMGGGAQQSQPSGMGQWISDEAKAAVANLGGGAPQGGGMGMGMGGMGMGGMSGMGMGGMGMMGGGQQSAPQSMKSVILDYLKKRAFFLIMFGLCAVLLSTTIFTDIGIKLGSWILNRLMGVEQNFPE